MFNLKSQRLMVEAIMLPGSLRLKNNLYLSHDNADRNINNVTKMTINILNDEVNSKIYVVTKLTAGQLRNGDVNWIRERRIHHVTGLNIPETRGTERFDERRLNMNSLSQEIFSRPDRFGSLNTPPS